MKSIELNRNECYAICRAIFWARHEKETRMRRENREPHNFEIQEMKYWDRLEPIFRKAGYDQSSYDKIATAVRKTYRRKMDSARSVPGQCPVRAGSDHTETDPNGKHAVRAQVIEKEAK